jgi:glutamine synthetase
VFLNGPGSSAHAHISVHRTDDFTDRESESLSPLEEQFLSGMLTHMRALPALTLPTPASYKRVVDGVWSGGTYINWGTENREAPVRLCNARSTTSRNFEVRILDATANPHIALAGMLKAGLEGIVKELPLSIRDCTGKVTAAQMDEAGRKALGIEKRLPLSWEEGREAFVEDTVISGWFGEEFVNKYLSVNKVRWYISFDRADSDEFLSFLVIS